MRTTLLSLTVLIGACTCNQCDAQFFRGRGQQYSYQPYQPAPPVQPSRQGVATGGTSHFDPNRKIDGAQHYNSERMPELPQGEKLEVWVVLSPNWQQIPLERAIVDAYNRDPRLQQIKQGTKFNYYVSTNPLFRSSPLVERVGTATPIFVVTGPGGEIAADGSAGLFMNAKSCPRTAAECVDVLCDAIEHFNPPPKFEGQTKNTPLVREISFPNLGPASANAAGDSTDQCGPDGCDIPNPENPPASDGQLPLIRPRRGANVEDMLAGSAFLALVGGLTYLGIARPGRAPRPFK